MIADSLVKYHYVFVNQNDYMCFFVAIERNDGGHYLPKLPIPIIKKIIIN